MIAGKGSRQRRALVPRKQVHRNHEYTFAPKSDLIVTLAGERWPLTEAGERYVTSLRDLVKLRAREGKAWRERDEAAWCEHLDALWAKLTDIDRELVERVDFDGDTSHPARKPQ